MAQHEHVPPRANEHSRLTSDHEDVLHQVHHRPPPSPVRARPSGGGDACSVRKDVPSSVTMMLVSVVIPCYNQAHFLGEAIESVASQTYPHFEVVVVDDGSTDNTAAVVTGYPGVRYFRQENQGLSAARNTGLRHSVGDRLVVLDADDRLMPCALEIGLTSLRDHPECAFVYGHSQFTTVDGSF